MFEAAKTVTHPAAPRLGGTIGVNGDKSASLRATLIRTVLWIVATVVAASVVMREVMRSREIEAAEAATAMVVGDIVSGTRGFDAPRGGDGPAALAEQWCGRLVSQPCILGAWVFDGGGELLGSATQADGLDPTVGTLPIRKGTCRSVKLSERFDFASARIVDASVDASSLPRVAAGGAAPVLRLLVHLPRSGAPWYQRLWMYAAPLLAVGAAGAAVGLWRINRRLLNPLERISRLVHDLTTRPEAPLTAHPEEYAQIVQALHTLRADRNLWRERAEQSAETVHVQVAKQTQKVYRELRRAEREVYTDPLTGLNNRRVLKDRFDEIFQSQADAGQNLSVIMLDIDHFKTLNDTQGHLSGDELLRFTAELIRGALRESDIAIRYGGDEFIVLLPSVDVEEAEAIAKRLVALFGQRAMLFSNLPRRPSLSAGVASLWRHRPTTAEELLQMADRALYDAKEAGKQAVHTFAGKLPLASLRAPSRV